MAVRKYIDEIHISNFKFFPELGQESKPIKIRGNHLLLYGENGSGKSSIFWALYTLLECANKGSKGEIKKYFDFFDKQNLLNIYANPRPKPDDKEVENAFVKLLLKDDAETTYYRISFNDLEINDIKEAKNSNYASDFINYKFLYSAFNFRHRDRINLFEHFEYNIFPYIKFEPCKIWKINPVTSLWEDIITENANEVIDFIANGPDYNLISGNRREYNTRAFRKREIASRISKAIQELRKWETHINTRGNEILKTELGYKNIEFNIKVKLSKNFHITRRKYIPPVIGLWLSIPSYEGNIDKVHRLHSFLNEAKLTGISLAMRFAVLEKRTTDAEIKLLVLDDLMISLDMNNRNKVIDFVFKNYLSKYQVFFLTHDKSLFDFVQLKIEEWDKKGNWEIKEMYAGNTGKPVLLEDNLEYIQRAKVYFDAYDYYSSGNNIRKAIEKKLEFLLPENVRVTTKDLDDELKKLFQYYDDNNCGDLISPILRNHLLQFKDIVFNPSSHFDLKSPLYKIEIEKAFEVFNILNAIPKICRYLLIGMRGILKYENLNNAYSAEFILKENLYAIQIPNNELRLSDPRHNLISYTKDEIEFLDPKTRVSKLPNKIVLAKNSTIKISERIARITRFINPENPIIINDFTTADGLSIQNLLDNINGKKIK